MPNPLVPRARGHSVLGAVLVLLSANVGLTADPLRSPGATLPWQTYEAEAMETNGAVLGPVTEPGRVETESSGLQCVRLAQPGQFIRFVVKARANTLTARCSLPDADHGGGTSGELSLWVNGRRVSKLPLTSHFTWLYGKYPFSNDPSQGKARNFYDEIHLQGLSLQPGDVVQLTWEKSEAAYCIVDLVDLEEIAAPLAQPIGSLSIAEHGAKADGTTDATDALRRAVAAAAVHGGIVWIPAGSYLVTGDILLPSHVTVQGAGMWYTRFIGDARLYAQADRRVRFKLKGTGITLSDFAIQGRLNYRNDQEPNDGIVGTGCTDCTVRRLWIEHTKVGLWIYNGARLHVEGCRIRNTLADGVNLCVGTFGCVVEECATRGTGDDCFAIWPAPSDQGFVSQGIPGNNVFRHCTGQLPFLANGGAIYGGHANRIEDCAFTDITTGCGILISTTFPTSDPALGLDYNFSGETVVSDCDLTRCGGWDHEWGFRGSVQICLDRRNISGLRLHDLKVRDSLSEGLTIVATGGKDAQGMLGDSLLDHSTVEWANGGAIHRGLWVKENAQGALQSIANVIPNVVNDANRFRISDH